MANWAGKAVKRVVKTWKLDVNLDESGCQNFWKLDRICKDEKWNQVSPQFVYANHSDKNYYNIKLQMVNNIVSIKFIPLFKLN